MIFNKVGTSHFSKKYNYLLDMLCLQLCVCKKDVGLIFKIGVDVLLKVWLEDGNVWQKAAVNFAKMC